MDSTQWTVIRAAAEGSQHARETFARRYEPVIRAYLSARWRHHALRGEMDDVTQEVFVDCFRPNGPLGRADPDRPGGFRAFLYGVVRQVARTAERRRLRDRRRAPEADLSLDRLETDDASLSKVFDRAWASALLRRAADLQLERARALGDEAVRRHRLLAMRFAEGLPIREIAARWEVDPAVLHREYPKARREFQAALADVAREEQGGGPEAVEHECERLLGFFSK